MSELIYFLCAATSAACAVLLLRSYRKNRSRILLWSAIGFVGFAGNNAMVVADLILFPDVEMSLLRMLPAFLGSIVMLGGIIWEIAK